MKVSVLMMTKNSERYVGEAISCVLNQSFKDFELIIVDGASTDRTLEIINGFNDPRIKIIRDDQGFLHSKNTGIDVAQGEYLALMDSDDLCLSRRFRFQVDALDNNPKAVVCWTDGWLAGPNGEMLALDLECKRQKNLDKDGGIFHTLLKRNIVLNGASMIRRSMLGNQRINLEHEVGEDWEFWLKLASKYSFVHVHEPLYGYRFHPGSRDGNDLMMTLKTMYWLGRLPMSFYRMFPQARKDYHSLLFNTFILPCASFVGFLTNRRLSVSLAKAKGHA